MTTNEQAQVTAPAASTDKTSLPSIAKALADVGQSWAAMGLSIGKNALEQTAAALQNTAKSLAVLADELTPKPEGDAK